MPTVMFGGLAGMCAQINRLQVGCTTDYTTRPKCMKPNVLNTLGNKKPYLRMVNRIINLVAGDGYAPPTSRL